MGLQPGGLDDHKDFVKQLIETVAFCKSQACTIKVHSSGVYAGIQAVALLISRSCVAWPMSAEQARSLTILLLHSLS